MHSIKVLYLFQWLVLFFFLSSLNANVQLSFYNDIADTPQETIVFESGSLFYTGALEHIDEFICTADNPSTETVLWFDARGNEVSEGDGSGTELYWTGTNGNKTLHTSTSGGSNLIDVNNQGNNFTCRLNGTADEKSFGIYWVRSILDTSLNVDNDVRGMRIYTKDTPPVISEYTLQRGFFNLDPNALYKVQSLKGLNIEFRPAPMEPSPVPALSIIDNVRFLNTTNCQSIGTSDDDVLYTTLYNGPYLNFGADEGSDAPSLDTSECIANGTASQTVLSRGAASPDLKYTCPLVYNGIFENLENLNIDIESKVVFRLPGENANEFNRRRMWVNFGFSNRIDLRYDREYVCRDMYGTSLSFRVIVTADSTLEILESDTATAGVTGPKDYISTSIPNTLYCLAMNNNAIVTWLSDTNANRSASTTPVPVTTNTSISPYIDTPRDGRSDLVLNSGIALDREGYYTCSGSSMEITVGIFSQSPVAPTVTTTPSESSQNISFISPIIITCIGTNSPHPPPLFYWTGPRPSSTHLIDTTNFQVSDSGDYTCHGTNVVGASNVTISILIVAPPPMLVAYNTSIPDFFFEQDSFQLFCTFSIATNLALTPNISWYRNSTRLTDGTNGYQVEQMSTGDPLLYRSVLSVSSAMPANSGQFYCSATVGNSGANTSFLFSIEVEPAYQPDAVSVELDRIGYLSAQISWNATNRVRLTPETYVVSHCQLPACSSFVSSSVLTANYYTITQLMSVTNYSVFVITTNRYGSTNGVSRNFTTMLERALYFEDWSKSFVKTYFASGSIFRGGIEVAFAIRQFYCVPDYVTDTITWYAPNGDIIPKGFTATSFYHTIDGTGESRLNLGTALTADNDGWNFTCRINTSGFVHDHHFGVYFILDVITTRGIVGIRLFSKNDPPVVRAFTLQRGIFDFDFTQLYDIESLQLNTRPPFTWVFEPELILPINPDPTLQVLTDIQFNNTNAICQLGYSIFNGDFFSISNRPFVVRTPVVSDYINGPPLIDSSCIEDGSTAYVFTIGGRVDIAVVCPLLYGARFLDISPNEFIQYDYILNAGGNNTRRLLVDPTQTLAMIVHDRTYVCQDRYGVSSSFRARVDASTPLEVFNSSTTVYPTNNGTSYITNQTTLYCLSDSNLLAVEWYTNTNPNRSIEVIYTLVSNVAIELPYVSNPRVGRSDLIVNTLPSDRQGYFYCRDSMDIILSYSIFSQLPVSPMAVISPDTTSIEITIGSSNDVLICGFSNSPHPYTISYWAGTSSELLDTSLLLEPDTGDYTCVSSNVVYSSTDSISITVIPPAPQSVNSTQLLTEGDIFATDTFQLSCAFSTFVNVTSPISILWYHNETINTVSTNTTSVSGIIATSTLTITSASVSDTGQYECVATVGASLSANSPAIIVIVNPSYLPDAIPLVVSSITFFTAFVSWNRTSRTPLLMENYSVAYRTGSSSPIYQLIPDGSTSFTLTGLISNSNYTAYIYATNRFGNTEGPTASFTTELIRLYFLKSATVVPFRTGSIFRGGIHSNIFDVVSEYHCSPDSSDQVITWYQPDGIVIPPGTPSSTGFYHTRDNTTGESVFYTNNAVSLDNEGNNFTCSFIQTYGVMNVSSFGIYYARRDVSTLNLNGIRLYGTDNIIYELVYQRGVFNIDFTQLYTVECLTASLPLSTHWRFIPAPLYPSDTATTNTTIYQVLFDPNAVCQYIRCAPFVQYTVFSNESFLLQSNPDNIAQGIECIPNDYEYSFSLGAPLDIALTCPLIFGARFLDIGTDITLIQNEISTNSSRRLFINQTVTIATLDKDRTYVCEDKYGDMVSFRISINTAGSDPIQILPNGSSTVPIVNGTYLIGSSNIPDALLCVTQSASNAANWYVDSNPNRSTGQSPVLVTTDPSILPHVVSPRDGRSNLVLNGTIGDAKQGLYSCVTNPTLVLGIFSQTPVAPIADISLNQTSIQVVIGTDTPTLSCVTSNIPYPLPIYFWTGSVSSSTADLNTGLLLEADTGMYVCTASNVIDLSTDSIMIIVVPPSPQFIYIQTGTASPIYLDDPFTLECQFSTFPNITSQITIQWYQNNTQVVESSTVNINTAYSGSVVISSLTVSTSQIDQTGDYQCRATVGGSQQAMSTNLSFNFTQPLKPFIDPNSVNSLSPYVTQLLEITCELKTLPRFRPMLSIKWYHNVTILLFTGGTVMITNETPNANTTISTLKITSIEFQRSGNYHCVGQVLGILNSQIVESNKTSVQVQRPPNPTEILGVGIENLELYVTFTLNLACEFQTLEIFVQNLQIDWYHNDTKIQSSMGVTFESNRQETDRVISNLSISNINMEQGGIYYCVSTVVPYSVTRKSINYTVSINGPVTPEIPIDNISENVSINYITFVWMRSIYYDVLPERYVVFYRVLFDTGMYIMTSETTNTYLVVSGLVADTEYEYYIELINTFGTSRSGVKTVRTSTMPKPPSTGGLSGLIGPIAGGIIVALFVTIIVLIIVLLLIFLKKRRDKLYKFSEAEIDQRYHKSINYTDSQNHLITENVGLSVGSGLGDGKFAETTEEQRSRPANTTFRKSMEIQETVMFNTDAAEPLYEDFTYERYNVPIDIFPQRILEYHLANNAEFDKQFSSLRKDFIHDVTTGSNVINKPKNRFANIIPYEHSRVKLSFTGENHSDYINACYIDGYYHSQTYIAAQGPMPHTVKEFWKMIWEKNIEHIVALTRVMEAMKKKCEQYWPEKEQDTSTIGDFEIKLKKIDRYTSYDIRVLELKNSDYPKDSRIVIQFHFTVWPDHGVPIFSSSLLAFINHTKEFHIPGKTQSPILIHCSAGVGRTGTFIVLDYFLEHLKENEKVNVYKMVAQLRESRCLMVQTKDQYMFIHDAIMDIISCTDTFIADHNFQRYYENALIRDLNKMTTPFEDKYELIMKTSRIVDPRDISESSDVANVMKNRYPSFVPFDSHRVSIIPDQDGEKDYINASFVHSYQKHKGFIAAQGPLEFTVYDFWKMITKYRIQIIVMLTDLVEDGHEMCAKYWPEEGKEMLVHYLVIRCEKEESLDLFIRRKLVVSTQQVRICSMYQYYAIYLNIQ